MKTLICNLLVVCLLLDRSTTQNCFSSSSSSLCLNYFRVSSCSCTGNCDPAQQISKDVTTLKSLTTQIEQKDPASCLYFNATGIRYPPQCCSFPFTLNGTLNFKCASGSDEVLGCYLRDRVWVPCNDQSGYSVTMETKDISIPTFPSPIKAPSVNGWIVFQQRINADENFDRPWSDYRDGFGGMAANFWLGLEKIYQLCSQGNCQLRVEVYSANNFEWVSEEHSIFFLDSEYGEYAIHFWKKSGDGDAYFSSRPNSNGVINGMRFTTKDKDHDTRPTENCAVLWSGGWWYNNCCWFNLNGAYRTRGFAGGNGLKLISMSRMMLKVA